MTFERFLELLEAMRARDEEATAELCEWLSERCQAWFGSNEAVILDPQWREDVVGYLYSRLVNQKAFDAKACRDLPAALAWLKRVASNYLNDKFRKDGRNTPFNGMTGSPGEEDDGEKYDPPDPHSEEKEDQTETFRKRWEQLDRIHHIVRNSLRPGRVDFVAVYLLHFRLQLYSILRRLEAEISQDPRLLMDTVQDAMPWSEEDQRRSPREEWPSLGDLWQGLREQASEKKTFLITAEVVAKVAAELSSQPRTSTPDAFYQWRRRLRKKLQDLIDNGAFADIEALLLDAWKKVVFLKGD